MAQRLTGKDLDRACLSDALRHAYGRLPDEQESPADDEQRFADLLAKLGRLDRGAVGSESSK